MANKEKTHYDPMYNFGQSKAQYTDLKWYDVRRTPLRRRYILVDGEQVFLEPELMSAEQRIELALKSRVDILTKEAQELAEKMEKLNTMADENGMVIDWKENTVTKKP